MQYLNQNVVYISCLPMYGTCSINLTLLYLPHPNSINDKYKLQSSSLCNFLGYLFFCLASIQFSQNPILRHNPMVLWASSHPTIMLNFITLLSVLLPLQNFACQHIETASQYGNMNLDASNHETAWLIQSYFLQNKQS
jgi:hypothetical protein